MFSYLSMNEVIQEELRDTNKQRNLQSTDPVFADKFKREWDEITGKLRELNKGSKTEKEKEHESYRYSANGIEFR